MKMICSAHKKRGEEVLEFNLSPHYFKDLNNKTFNDYGRPISIISQGWKTIDDFYYYELITSEGIKFITNLTYTIA